MSDLEIRSGGAIAVLGGSLELSACTLTQNYALRGGAISSDQHPDGGLDFIFTGSLRLGRIGLGGWWGICHSGENLPLRSPIGRSRDPFGTDRDTLPNRS